VVVFLLNINFTQAQGTSLARHSSLASENSMVASGVLTETERHTPKKPLQDFWSCNFHVDDPHHSTHEPGNINVVAKFNCNMPVVEITLIVQLARDGNIISTQPYVGTNVTSFEGNTATPCVSGMYQGGAIAIITLPPGSASTSRVLRANSNQRYLTCP